MIKGHKNKNKNKSIIFMQLLLQTFVVFVIFVVFLFLAPSTQAQESKLGIGKAANIHRPKEMGAGTFIQWSGHYRVRGLYQENLFRGSSDDFDLYSHRLRLNGSFSPNDDTQAHFSANLYGVLGGNRRGDLGLDASLVDDSSDGHKLQLLKIYGEWDFWRGFFLRFGRQQLNWGNEAIISSNEDDDRPYSFDGLVLHYSDSVVHFQTGVFKLGDWSSRTSQNGANPNSNPNRDSNPNPNLNSDGNSNPNRDSNLNPDGNPDPSEDSYFVSIELKGFLNFLKEIQFLLYRTQADNFENTDLGINIQGGTFNRFGVALNGEGSRLYYTLDYINFSGDYSGGTAASGSMGHIKLGGIWGGGDSLRAYIVGHLDTGDDSSSTNTNEKFDPLYYNHHNYAGLMDLLAWGNLTYYGAGFEYRPDESQFYKLQWLTFQRTETGSGVSSINYLGFDQAFITEDINQNTNAVITKDLGFEVDFLYRKNYDSNAFLEFIVGVFVPGDYLESYGRAKEIYSARLTTGFSF